MPSHDASSEVKNLNYVKWGLSYGLKEPNHRQVQKFTTRYNKSIIIRKAFHCQWQAKQCGGKTIIKKND